MSDTTYKLGTAIFVLMVVALVSTIVWIIADMVALEHWRSDRTSEGAAEAARLWQVGGRIDTDQSQREKCPHVWLTEAQYGSWGDDRVFYWHRSQLPSGAEAVARCIRRSCKVPGCGAAYHEVIQISGSYWRAPTSEEKWK